MAGCSSYAIQYVNPLVTIIKRLTDVYVEVNQSVSLQCKVINSLHELWFKNGDLIPKSDKRKLQIKDNYSIKLCIKSARYSDSGVYTIICSDNLKNIECKCIVTIIPKSRAVLYSSVWDPNNLGVIKPMRSITTMRGGTIALYVEFKSENINGIMWYKNNMILEIDNRAEISENRTSSELIIYYAAPNDSGVYTAVIETNSGIDSNYTDVRVINELCFIERGTVPRIIEPLPRIVNVNTNEEARLFCKIRRNQDTEIIWQRDQTTLDFTDGNHIQENCGPDHIGIRILNPILGYEISYKVYLSNNESFATSSCLCIVKEPPVAQIPLVNISKSLETVVASCGQQVIFDCKFSLEDKRYYYVVWRLGRYTIKRSCDKFNVAFQGGQYILNVKEVQYGMEGTVVCELRLYVPHKKSLLVCKSVGYLTIVPPSVLKNLILKSTAPKPLKAFEKHHNYVIEDYREPTYTTMIDEDTENVGVMAPGDLVMEIFYSRLDNIHYYVSVLRPFNYKDVDLVIRDRTHEIGDGQNDMLLEFTWFDVMFEDIDIHFNIEIHHEKGYKVIGVTDYPKLKIANPCVDEMVRICINTVTKNPEDIPSEIVIDMRRVEQEYWDTFFTVNNNRITYRDLETFSSLYTLTRENIGCGSTGMVVVVEGERTSENRNKFFAGKLFAGSLKKSLKAQHEYKLLRTLKHKKIVFMECAFKAIDNAIIVLEYLWGGELCDVISERNRIDEDSLVCYIKQICEALAYLRDQNVAHLDIKPHNIVLEHPNSRKIKLVDFGIAKRYRRGYGWFTKGVLGAKVYASPEILRQALISSAADMWSLGILIYTMLTGMPPFPENIWDTYLNENPIFKDPSHELSISDDSSLSYSSASSDSGYSYWESFESSSSSTCSNITTPSDLKLRNDDSSSPYINCPPSSSQTIPLWGSVSEIALSLFIYDNPYLDDVSLVAKDFLERLFTLNILKRMKPADALKHPWLKLGPSRKVPIDHELKIKMDIATYMSPDTKHLKTTAYTTIGMTRVRKTTTTRNVTPVQEIATKLTQVNPDENTMPKSTHVYSNENAVAKPTHVYSDENTVPKSPHDYPDENTVSKSTHTYPDENTVPKSTQVNSVGNTVPKSTQVKPDENTVPKSPHVYSDENTVPKSTQVNSDGNTVPKSTQVNPDENTATISIQANQIDPVQKTIQKPSNKGKGIGKKSKPFEEGNNSKAQDDKSEETGN